MPDELYDLQRDIRSWISRRKFQNFCRKQPKFSVLLVARNPLLVHYFVKLLDECAEDLFLAEGEDEALSLVQSNSPDVVIIDDVLSEAVALPLLDKMRRTHPDTMVLFLRTPGRKDDVAQGDNVFVIEKPFELREAVNTLRKALRHMVRAAKGTALTKHRDDSLRDTVRPR
ncbi:MAG: response regulator [Nitrospirota bacterium]